MARYGNIDYVLKMKFGQAKKLVDRAVQERDAENLFKVYLVDRKHQLYLLANGAIKKGDILTFKQYYDQVMPEKAELDHRSTDDIVNEILSIKFPTQEREE